MKKAIVFLLALCCAALTAAELPDLSKSAAWSKAGWSKSVYTCTEDVLCIERTQDGSGAWRTKAIPVKAGEKISGSVEINYSSQDGPGVARLGINCLDGDGKRVKFLNPIQFSSLTDGFETKTFSITVPEGAVQIMVYACLDKKGKVEFRNFKFDK